MEAGTSRHHPNSQSVSDPSGRAARSGPKSSSGSSHHTRSDSSQKVLEWTNAHFQPASEPSSTESPPKERRQSGARYNRYHEERDELPSGSLAKRARYHSGRTQSGEQDPEQETAKELPDHPGPSPIGSSAILGTLKVIPAIMPPPITGTDIRSTQAWEQARAVMLKQTNQNLLQIAGYSQLWKKK